MQTNITPELVRNALEHIPANLTRVEWVRIGMAINNEFPDDAGFELFSAWSATGASFDSKAVQTTWRSIKPDGGVTIATLFAEAKKHGFTLSESVTVPTIANSPEAAAQRKKQREQDQIEEQGRIRLKHESTANDAQALWDMAMSSETGWNAYLERKGVKPYGVRFLRDDLLVPLRDETGKLWNVQRIAPEKPANGTDKRYLPGGRKSGLWHWLGDPFEEVASGTDPGVILIAEGYATGASLYQATSQFVAVAFDAGNLPVVARALRAIFKSSLLVICGDDDRQTFAKTKRNPGREAAKAAAKAVGGIAVFPNGLPEGGSDFNDLHQHIGADSGLDAVRRIVLGAIDAHQANATAPQSTQSKPDSDGSQPSGNAATQPVNGRDFFRVNEAGVWFVDQNGDTDKTLFVCETIRVLANAIGTNDAQAALLLEFKTRLEKTKTWLMPLAMLAGDGNGYRAQLLNFGFMTPADSRRRALLTQYLQSRRPGETVRHVPRVGWHGRCFVLPGETLGQSESDERLMFNSEAGVEANFAQRGTLEAWIQNISRLCVGNSRPTLAVATAFAGPLLFWSMGTGGGGFHFVGGSSVGKSSSLLMAASVWGKGTEKDPDSYMQKWRATGPALEYLAEQHNDCCLILDEIGQLDPREAATVAYMLADGAGKNRGKASGGLRAKPSWRMLFLSSGELKLSTLVESIGAKSKAGQEVRLIPIASEVVAGSTFEYLHEFSGGHELATWVQTHAAQCYGVAGRAWLEYLVAHTTGLSDELSQRIAAVESQMVPPNASGQVKRGGRRFALVAVAGELATLAGLTGWHYGWATDAIKICFNAWIASRGGVGASEVTAMLKQVQSFFELHGDARFTWWHRVGDDHAPKTINRAGFKRAFDADGDPYKNIGNATFDIPLGKVFEDGGTSKFYVLPKVFEQEVCNGLDKDTVCALLLKKNVLYRKDEGRYQLKVRLPGVGHAWTYCITDEIFSLDV